MKYFGFSSSPESQQQERTNSSEILDSNNSGHEFSSPLSERPLFTLDDLKRAGVPLKSQLSPYMQVNIQDDYIKFVS